MRVAVPAVGSLLCAAAVSRLTPPRMNVAELLQFTPTVPPLAPGTAAVPAFRIEGGALSAPVWLSELSQYAVLDRGLQVVLRLGSDEPAQALPDAMVAHEPLTGVAVSDPGARSDSRDDRILVTALVASGGPARSLRCITVDPAYLVPVPLEGADALSAVCMLHQVSAARLLVGTDDGRLLCLSRDAAPATLLSGVAPGALLGACVSSDEKTLYLCGAASVSRCELNLDAGTCSTPAELPQLAASLAPGSALAGVACDVSGNLYVAASEGVLVVDETGDATMRLPTPVPASGLCFGGGSMSELIVTAGDTLWTVQTSTQGVTPPSADFLKTMEKLAAEGDFRHVGW